MDDAEEVRTIGRLLVQIRRARRKSQQVVAELAGINRMTLSRIENGERALTRLPVPAPANGHTDSTTEAVRLALDAIDVGRPGGLVLPVTVNSTRSPCLRPPPPPPGSIYWVHYGRALAQVRGRQDDAVRALRKAEEINPILVRRHPMARDVIAVLLPGARRNAVGQELRRMAFRAGLPV